MNRQQVLENWRKGAKHRRLVRQARRLGCECLESRDLLSVLAVGPGAAFATIQDAVDHAFTDDVIEVASGSYQESIDWSRMGSAVGRTPGNLTIRGAATNVVVHSSQGPTISNSAALTGNLNLQQLILESNGNQSSVISGVSLQNVQGGLKVSNCILQQTAGHGLDLSQISGAVVVVDSQFVRLGDGPGDVAIRLREVAGSVVLRDNTFDNVADRAFDLSNDNSDLLLMVDDNTVHGDATNYSTTKVAFDIRLGSASTTDFSLVNNQVDGAAEAAVMLTASQNARLQSRFVENNFSNIYGPFAVLIDQRGSAQLALSGESNTISDLSGSGWRVSQHDASQLNAVFSDNLFLNIGNDSGNQALVFSSDSSGASNLRIEKNDFATVAGDALVLTSSGSGTTNALVTDNVFTEANSVVGTNAIAAFRAVAGAAGAVRLRLDSNTVLDGGADAFLLEQSGTATFGLAGTLADARLQIEADNVGTPVTIRGTVTVVLPGLLTPFTPLLLGDTAWLDLDGNGMYDQNDIEVLDMKLTLTGTETSSGAAISRETLTDGRGRYQFSGLQAGDYSISIILPQGSALVPPLQGTDSTIDSDFDRSTRRAAVVLGGSDELTIDAGLWPTWQNPANRLDVDDDSLVIPRDVLLIINDLNANGARLLPEPFPTSQTPRYYDVDGNGFIAPLDVLQVINYLNVLATGAPEGEGNPVAVTLRRDEAPRGIGRIGQIQLIGPVCANESSRRSVLRRKIHLRPFDSIDTDGNRDIASDVERRPRHVE